MSSKQGIAWRSVPAGRGFAGTLYADELDLVAVSLGKELELAVAVSLGKELAVPLTDELGLGGDDVVLVVVRVTADVEST
jgi:hypothetical protein